MWATDQVALHVFFAALGSSRRVGRFATEQKETRSPVTVVTNGTGFPYAVERRRDVRSVPPKAAAPQLRDSGAR
jgi:hypothetical protein